MLKTNLLQNQQASFNQTWYKSSLGKGISKLYNLIKDQLLFKGEVITNFGEVIEKFSP
jgi:hypothetical protein